MNARAQHMHLQTPVSLMQCIISPGGEPCSSAVASSLLLLYGICIRARTPTFTHTHTPTPMRVLMQMHPNTHTRTCTRRRRHMHRHKHRHRHRHTHTHAHTHAHPAGSQLKLRIIILVRQRYSMHICNSVLVWWQINKDVRRMDMVSKPDGSPPDLERKANLCIFEVLTLSYSISSSCKGHRSRLILCKHTARFLLASVLAANESTTTAY